MTNEMSLDIKVSQTDIANIFGLTKEELAQIQSLPTIVRKQFGFGDSSYDSLFPSIASLATARTNGLLYAASILSPNAHVEEINFNEFKIERDELRYRNKFGGKDIPVANAYLTGSCACCTSMQELEQLARHGHVLHDLQFYWDPKEGVSSGCGVEHILAAANFASIRELLDKRGLNPDELNIVNSEMSAWLAKPMDEKVEICRETFLKEISPNLANRIHLMPNSVYHTRSNHSAQVAMKAMVKQLAEYRLSQ